jgi:biopolymer transport protein ExbB
VLWRFLTDGGWTMAPIALCSIAALALLLERSWFWAGQWLRRDPELERDLVRLRVDAARAERTGDPVCRVLAAAIRHPEDASVPATLAERLLEESRAGVPVLHVVGGVATSLGLFGTVLGVSLAFEDTISTGRMSELTGTLSVALNTTMFGLLVFIPCFVAGSLFQLLTHRTAFRMEQAVVTVRARLRATAAARRDEATSAPPRGERVPPNGDTEPTAAPAVGPGPDGAPRGAAPRANGEADRS